MKAYSVLDTIGNTPIIKLNNLFSERVKVWMKMENRNPGGSIKDRIALSMIEEAENRGDLKPGSVIIEPTSGNTGVGLAMVGTVKKYKVILVMPESMSLERRKLMSMYGAQLELTPRDKGMAGAIAKAKELMKKLPNAWMPMQFDNLDNVKVHYEKTALEILNDFPQGFDYMITGVGTGGHITGVAQLMKSKNPKMKVYAVEPANSSVIAGNDPGPHLIQGLGAGFVPSILDKSLLDGSITVKNDQAYAFARKTASQEGIFVGISSGASLAAVDKKLAEIEDGASILTFAYDTGERYLSVEGLFM
jgi:cysteine synthase